MRVLLYNWADCLDTRGGGVTTYLRNLMAELEQNPEIEPVFLSSGLSHDLRRRAPRWSRLRRGAGERYEIVNSGVLSPSHLSFGDPAQLSHPPTRDAFFDFVARTGPYDVIHFHNLEGLPADVLDLRARWPDTRVVLSLHNYYPICPQVTLWQQSRRSCRDYENGSRCATCLPRQWNPRLVRLVYAGAPWLMRVGLPGSQQGGARLARSLTRAGRRILRLRNTHASAPAAGGQGFAARRKGIVDRINQGCDLVLCVSDRTRQIAQHHGVAPALLRTSYIGSREAEKFELTRPAIGSLSEKKTLTLGFLGYMRPDKGGPFLFDALAALPPELAARIRLRVAARLRDPSDRERLDQLRAKLAAVEHHDGYSRDDLDDLLRDVDVGVVPVLWEDNLPQVAIEMHARHIPLLTSDRGGAQELANCSDMVFAAGDAAAFTTRLAALLAGDVDLDAYWRRARAPRTMSEHVIELTRHYLGENEPIAGNRAATKGLSCQTTERSGT